MKTSELIRRLQLELELRGNLAVVYESDDAGSYNEILEIGYEAADEGRVVIR